MPDLVRPHPAGVGDPEQQQEPAGPWLPVASVARRLGVAKSTAHRLLQTLGSRGFVEQDGHSGQYRLGIHIYELGALALARNELRHRGRA